MRNAAHDRSDDGESTSASHAGAREAGDRARPKLVAAGAPTEAAEAEEDVAAVYARYSPAILRFFTSKVPSGTADDARELTSVTFERYIRKRSSGPVVDKHGQPFRSARACLFGIAGFVLMEHLKAVTKARSVDDLEELSLADMSRGISSQLSLAEKKTLVHEKLRELPFFQQLVIECCVYQQMTYHDVAELLERPMGTIATWYRNGRARLGELLLAEYQHVPAAEEDAAARAEALAVYGWYDPTDGRVDARKLLRAIVEVRHGSGPLPAWFDELEIPPRLPNACAMELSNLMHSVWEAWRAAGRPR